MFGNQEYQRDMAARLVAADGAEAALEFARENGWDGLARQIEALAPEATVGAPAGAAGR